MPRESLEDIFGDTAPQKVATKPPLEDIFAEPKTGAAQTDTQFGTALASKMRGGARKQDPYSPPLGMQMDIAGAANPAEVRLALEKHAKPEDINQDKQGRWHVKIDGKDRVVEPEMLSKILTSSPSTIGGILGGVGGGAVARPAAILDRAAGRAATGQ